MNAYLPDRRTLLKIACAASSLSLMPGLSWACGSGRQRSIWYRNARFGLFIHWGPYSVASVEASWPIMQPTPCRGDNCRLRRKDSSDRLSRHIWASATIKQHAGLCRRILRSTRRESKLSSNGSDRGSSSGQSGFSRRADRRVVPLSSNDRCHRSLQRRRPRIHIRCPPRLECSSLSLVHSSAAPQRAVSTAAHDLSMHC